MVSDLSNQTQTTPIHVTIIILLTIELSTVLKLKIVYTVFSIVQVSVGKCFFYPLPFSVMTTEYMMVR